MSGRKARRLCAFLFAVCVALATAQACAAEEDLPPHSPLIEKIISLFRPEESLNGAVRFTNPAIEAGVRSALWLDEGAITGANLNQVRWLSITESQYGADLSDLRRLPKLEELTFRNCAPLTRAQIESLPPVGSLDVFFTDIEDPSALSGLRSLDSLAIFWSNSDDLSFLSGLGQLRSLSLGHLALRDVSSISRLNNLEELSASFCALEDAGFVSTLDGLRSLDLSGNRISDIGPVLRLAGLERLNLSGNDLRGKIVIQGLDNLKTLDLSYNRIDRETGSDLIESRGGNVNLWGNPCGKGGDPGTELLNVSGLEACERGDIGDSVQSVQRTLSDLGYLTGKADGVFGEETERAVRAFQRDERISQTGEVDGATRLQIAMRLMLHE